MGNILRATESVCNMMKKRRKKHKVTSYKDRSFAVSSSPLVSTDCCSPASRHSGLKPVGGDVDLLTAVAIKTDGGESGREVEKMNYVAVRCVALRARLI